MAYYRKRPVVIEAYRFVDDARPPEWLRNALNDGRVVYGNQFLGHLIVKTSEGDLRCQIGDWIIKGVKGENA